jgi:hypothetical protein
MSMDDNQFNQRNVEDDETKQQFRIEVADGDQGKNFTIRPLGNDRYEIREDDGNSIGTIQLDETNHARCESQGCELDLPLLHTIRDQIQFHYDWKRKSL